MARSKKDIDRELMYKKILPTAMGADGAADKTVPGRGIGATLPAGITLAGPEAGLQKPAEVAFEPPLAAEALLQKQPKPAFAPQPGQDETPLAGAMFATESPLVNLMEAFVEKRLDAALKKFKCCTCDRCRKDVLAIALNKLPPLYVIGDDADTRDLHERERAAQVATALVQAILVVKARPLHEINR